MTHPLCPDTAIDHATRSWTTFVVDRNRNARLSPWKTRTAADGQLLVSFEVVGPDAAPALAAFAGMAEYLRALQSDDLRPVFDYDTPDRVACVWRTAGVWVELWHPDTPPAAPAAPVPSQQTVRPPSLLSRASTRLPYTRRHTKETSS